jgi:hypothetical protein
MLKRNYYSRDDYERHKRLKHEYRTFNDVRVDDPSLPQRIRNLILNEHTKENNFLQSFLPSILEQFEKKGYLTQKQVDILEKNEKQFDPMNIESARKEYEQWCSDYDDEKREIAKKVAEYYRNEYTTGRSTTFYYEKVATQILENPDYIPRRQQYEKMVNNKYAQQWLKNSSAQPKFAVGDYVCVNSQTKNYWNQRNYGSTFEQLKKYEVGAVIEIKPPVANRKGAHIYVVLPMGGTKVVEIEERFLKKAKGI